MACVVALHGCSAAEPDPVRAERQQQRSTDGPLSVDGVVGGQSFLPPEPDTARWRASQGSFPLCTTGEGLTLEGVRTEGEPAPLAVEPWVVDRVPTTSRFVTFGGVLGSPPTFDEPYASADYLRGRYVGLEGATVDEPCPGTMVTESGIEVVLAVETDQEGAVVAGFWIDYRSGGELYALWVDWTMILCGDATPRGRCRGR